MENCDEKKFVITKDSICQQILIKINRSFILSSRSMITHGKSNNLTIHSEFIQTASVAPRRCNLKAIVKYLFTIYGGYTTNTIRAKVNCHDKDETM